MSTTSPLPRLRVTENRRFLEYDDGTPFFYLGDTAWELFHRLDYDESDYYLSNRAAKGFSVIQAVLLGELDGIHTRNANGDLPLEDDDPTRPVEEYFAHVDRVVDRAAELGIVMGLLPAWGDKWQSGPGKGPVVLTPENSEEYGRFLGERYRDKPVIWILGGDRNIQGDTDRAVIEALAKGLREGDAGEHLITFHPRGPGRSSDYWHESEWLDFNMCQSSHAARGFDNGLFADHDRRLVPVRVLSRRGSFHAGTRGATSGQNRRVLVRSTLRRLRPGPRRRELRRPHLHSAHVGQGQRLGAGT